MIKIKPVSSETRRSSCDNCNREVPFVLEYKFFSIFDIKEPFVTLTFCEDCSNALSNLHYKCMAEGKSFVYDLDEIQENQE